MAPPSVRKEIIVNVTFINKVVSSCFYTIRSLARIKAFLNESLLKTLVCTLVFSKLDYCNILYYGLNSQSLKKLQAVQNSVVRLVNKVGHFDRLHVTDLFNKLHWLKIRERIVYKVLLIVHKCIIGLAPVDLTQCSSRKKLVIKPCNGNYGNRAFSVFGPNGNEWKHAP